jgi:hypothetical protein
MTTAVGLIHIKNMLKKNLLIMEKRAYDRTPANMLIKFFYDNAVYTGTIKNLSENGMYIETEDYLYYYKSKFIIHIPFQDDVIVVPVELRRLAKTKGSYKGIGVELLNPPERYLELLGCIKANL